MNQELPKTETEIRKKILDDFNVERVEAYGEWQLADYSDGAQKKYKFIASHAWNTIKLEYTIQEANISEAKFEVFVKGTGPKFEDEFEVEFILQRDGKVVKTASSGKQKCEASGEATKIRFELTELQQNDQVIAVCKGKDEEHWGGNFGTQFFD